jgi:flagellar motor switch protein FliG
VAAVPDKPVEAFFSGMSKRQTMLLLTAMTYGGQDAVASFEHLPDDEAEILKHRAQEMLQIPREKRIPLLVTEVKRLLTARRGGLWSADPERLSAILKDERPALIEVVLRALPVGLADEVRKRLPPVKVQLRREVRLEVLNIVRWRLEQALARRAPGRIGFRFSDLLQLKTRELITVLDRMGARALAISLAGLPDAEREQFLAQLTPDQRQLAVRAIAAGASRKLAEADAREILIRYDTLKGSQVALRNAGAQRVARACLAQSHEFAARMVERHRGELGTLLRHWVRHERPKITGKADFGRADIVEQLERLAAKGLIDRPVRLPPPPPNPPGPAAQGMNPAVLQPPPQRIPSPVGGAYSRGIKAADSRRQDMMAAREARKAGLPMPVGRRPTPGDMPKAPLSSPVLRAGSPTNNPPGRPITSPVIEKPPVVKKPSHGGSQGGTSVQRAPRVVGRGTGARQMPKMPAGRGSKGDPEGR